MRRSQGEVETLRAFAQGGFRSLSFGNVDQNVDGAEQSSGLPKYRIHVRKHLTPRAVGTLDNRLTFDKRRILV